MNKKIAFIIALALLLTSISTSVPVARASDTVVGNYILPPLQISWWENGTAGNLEWRSRADTNSWFAIATNAHLYIDGSPTAAWFAVNLWRPETGNWGMWGGYATGFAKVLVNDGAIHVLSWPACQFTFNTVVIQVAAGSFSTRFPAPGGGFLAAQTFGYQLPYVPPSVTIAGPSTAAVGIPTSLGAVITNGTAPYEEQWTVFADRNGQDYSGTRSTDNVNFSHTYLATSEYTVRVQVWDATGTETEATAKINGQVVKPVMHGQLLETGAAGTMLAFGMYTDANSAEGVIPWANCVPTNDYVVTWPEVTLTAQTWYQLLTASAYPNPLLVTTRYTEANGQQWTYSFSFDTTSLVEAGSYIKSDGDSGHIEEAPPTWLQGVLNWATQMFKDIFKWAFVPTTAQMESLMPGGSLGTALLDQTTWGTGSGEWNLTVHAGAIAIPLVDISFATIASWTFVTVIKTGIQAVMCVALIYMIVTLI